MSRSPGKARGMKASMEKQDRLRECEGVIEQTHTKTEPDGTAGSCTPQAVQRLPRKS